MMKFRPDRYHHGLAEKRFLMLASVALYIIFGTAMVFASSASFSILNGYFIVAAIMLANTGFSFLPGLGEKQTPVLFTINSAMVSIHTYGLMYFSRLDPTFTIAAVVITFAVMDAMVFVSLRLATVIYSLLMVLLLGTLAAQSQMNPWIFVGAMLPALVWRYFTYSSQVRLQDGDQALTEADQEKAKLSLMKSVVTMSNQINHPIANIKISLSQIDSAIGKNAKLKNKLQPALNRIYKSVLKMNGILNGFRQFSRLNEKESFSDCPVRKILETVVLQFKSDVFYRKFKINLVLSEESPVIRCQKGSMTHVISEIIYLMTENISEVGDGKITVEDNAAADWVELIVELSISSGNKSEMKTWGYIEYAHLSQLVGKQRGFLEFEPSEASIRVKVILPRIDRKTAAKAA